MSSSMGFAASDDGLAALRRSVGGAVDFGVRLPDWPFRAASGFVTIYEYDRVLGGDFGSVLKALVSQFNDDVVTVIGVNPVTTYYRDAYGFFPGFQLDGASIGEGYGAALRWEPRGDPTGALGDTLNVVAIAGSSGGWSLWGQRDWEIGLLLTEESDGAWLNSEIPWFSRDIDLDTIRSPAGWGMPLSDSDLSLFQQNMIERGSGPGLASSNDPEGRAPDARA